MKCRYESSYLATWALIALLLSFAIADVRLPEEMSRLSQGQEAVCLPALLNVAYATADLADLKWRRLFQLHSTDGVVPRPTALHGVH